MSDSQTPKYQIDLIYSPEDATSSEMEALRNELENRGHAVSLRSLSAPARIVDDFSRTIVQPVREAAETAYKTVLNVLDPVLPKSAATEATESDSGTKPKADAPAFASIGPDASKDSDRAAVMTTTQGLQDIPFDVFRIGLIPHTEFKYTWNPSQLDAIVIPHKAMRGYLEYTHWAPDSIFEGGWLTSVPKATDTKAALRTRFGLPDAGGPILLIMANTFANDALQTVMLQFSMVRLPCQLFFYYGDSVALSDSLRLLAARFGVNARMFGKASPLSDYLAIADLVILCPHDESETILERLGIPMMLVTDGTPSARAQFLLHEKAAAHVAHDYELGTIVAQYAGQPSLVAELAEPAGEIAEIASVPACADAIEAALAARRKLAQKPPQAQAAFSGFETIGQPQAGGSLDFLQPVPVMQTAQPAPVSAPFAQIGAPVVPAPPVTSPSNTASPILTPAQTAVLTPTVSPKSYKDIKKQYAQLLLAEQSVDRSLDAASAEVAKWEERIDLARQNNNDKLVNEAMIRLRSAQSAEMSLFQQKDQISQQKALLRQSAHLARTSAAPSSSFPNFIDDEFSSTEEDPLEKEFKSLKQNQRLANLRSKMGLK